jgi:hypothetical protein
MGFFIRQLVVFTAFLAPIFASATSEPGQVIPSAPPAVNQTIQGRGKYTPGNVGPSLLISDASRVQSGDSRFSDKRNTGSNLRRL